MNWFKCKVAYRETTDGQVRNISKTFMVNATSFTEAEARVIEEVTPFVSDQMDVVSVKKSNISEIIRDGFNDKWYLVKVAFIALNERTGTEKRMNCLILVAGSDFKGAYENFLAGMKDVVADYEIVSLAETPILEIFQ